MRRTNCNCLLFRGPLAKPNARKASINTGLDIGAEVLPRTNVQQKHDGLVLVSVSTVDPDVNLKKDPLLPSRNCIGLAVRHHRNPFVRPVLLLDEDFKQPVLSYSVAVT